MTHHGSTLSSSALLFPSCPLPPTTSLCSISGKALLFGLGGGVVSIADRLSVIVGAKIKMGAHCKNTKDSDLNSEE